MYVNSLAGVELKKCIHSYTTLWVSQLCCSAECKDICASFRDAIVSFMDQTQRISAGVCKPIYFTMVLFLQTSLASNNMNNVMVIYRYHWCVSQKEMKRFVLIRVPPTVSWWWCWNEPRNQRIHQPRWTVLRYSRYKGFTSQGYSENQTQRPRYMLHDEEDLPSLRSQRPVSHTNGRAI